MVKYNDTPQSICVPCVIYLSRRMNVLKGSNTSITNRQWISCYCW